MIFRENRLPADDSHEISCLICYFLKKSIKSLICRLLQVIVISILFQVARQLDVEDALCAE